MMESSSHRLESLNPASELVCPIEDANEADSGREITDIIFDSRYDESFEQIVKLAAGLFQTEVKISFPSGDVLRGRATSRGKPIDAPLSATLCGMALSRGVPVEFENAQNDKDAVECPAVKKSGVNFYSNRLIRVRGGEVVGTLCLFATSPRSLTDEERRWFDALGNLCGQVVQGILDSHRLINKAGADKERGVELSRVDFTSLFEVSPVPTAVFSYPKFLYVAANDPMLSERGIPLDLFVGGADESDWLPDFKERLERDGIVQELELKFRQNGNGSYRYMLLDGRIVQFDGQFHVIVTGRDITDERERDRSLGLLLEGTNVRLGDDWFRGAAFALADLLDSELVYIGELNSDGNGTRTVVPHAILDNGEIRDDEAFVILDSLSCPIFEGGPIGFEDDLPPKAVENCPFWKPEFRSMQGVPVEDAEGEVIGVIVVATTRNLSSRKDQKTIFKIFASRAAAEIGRLRSDRARQAELERTSLLLEISRGISQSHDPEKMLQIAACQMGRVFGASRCHIHKVADDSVPIVAEFVEPKFAPMKGMAVPLSGNLHVVDILVSAQSVAVSDVFSSNRLAAFHSELEKFEVSSILSVRTSFEGRANGILSLQQCEKNRNWTLDEQELLEGIAAQIGASIAQAELAERELNQRLTAEAAQEKAEAASRSKGEFLARMSHELRTPMNAILGFSQLLSADDNLDEAQQETLAIINRSGEHLMTLINDVLEMSKIEAGKLEVNRSEFSPRNLIASLTDMFRIRAESNGLVLSVDMPDNLPASVESDENKLRQILTNLLGNAIKFTDQGRVELKGWYHAQTKASEQSALVFQINDTGAGISKEDQNRLFAPFVQTDTGGATAGGTGLGLTISKAFVELLGGQIRLESKVGEGSSFSFWIPCDEKTSTVSEGANPQQELRASLRPILLGKKKPRVLIADDQPENRLLAVRFLKGLGFTVREAIDGQDAIDVFRDFKPNCILMDIRMPHTDGLVATRTIRAMKDVQDQPYIIAVTGNAFEEDRKKALAAGCDHFVGKPVQLNELRDHLERRFGVAPEEDGAHHEKHLALSR